MAAPRAPEPRPAADVPAALPRPRPAPRLAQRADAEPGARCGCRRRQSDAAPYFANYVTDQLVSQYGRRAGVRRRAEGDDDDRPRPAEDRARRRSTRCCRPRSGRPRRSSRSTSTPATWSRWSAVATTTRASSTSRRRASASRARRSSRSCSRPRCEDGISPGSTLVSHPVVIDAGGRAWSVTQLRARRASARSTSRRRSRTRTTRSSRSSRISSGRRTSPAAAARHGDHDAAPPVLLDRPRRRARDAARDGARLRDARRRRLPARRLDLRRRAARRSERHASRRAGSRRRASTTRSPQADSTGSTNGNAGDRGSDAAGRRPVRHRHGGAAPRLGGRRQDRHDRELRRRLVRRLHAATS